MCGPVRPTILLAGIISLRNRGCFYKENVTRARTYTCMRAHSQRAQQASTSYTHTPHTPQVLKKNAKTRQMYNAEEVLLAFTSDGMHACMHCIIMDGYMDGWMDGLLSLSLWVTGQHTHTHTRWMDDNFERREPRLTPPHHPNSL